MKPFSISPRLSRNFPPEARYLVGVSGGRDSVVLLHWLVNLGYDKLIVCHLDHQLRGRMSDADARFVEKLAASYDRKTVGQALRLPGGRAGKRSGRPTKVDARIDFELAIVRPFLSVWRKEIDIYVREHRIKFREDASNKNLDPLRNRIRHRIIPYLEKIVGRNIRPAIWRAAAIAGEEEHWIEKQLPDSTDAQFSVARLRALPVALQRRAILKWLRAQKISEIGFDVIESVRSLADRDAATAKVNLPQDRHACRRAGNIFIE